MKLILFLLLFLITSLHVGNSHVEFALAKSNRRDFINKDLSSSYRTIFGNDYKDALTYFYKNKTLQNSIFTQNKVDKSIIVPVIFPERIRYSLLSDYFESEFMESIYVDYGSEYIDFSIGDFQMKASFIEKLEIIIQKDSILSKKYTFLLINNKNTKAERLERVKRLNSVKYQLNYISVFYEIILSEFDLSMMCKGEKIEFVAACYNGGFDKSQKEITKNIGLEYFPYGTKYPAKQYSYTNIAVDFYEHYYFQLF